MTHRGDGRGGLRGGGVKKTSPMKGKVFFTGDIHTYIHTDRPTDGHRASMTESAQWADSVKNTGVQGVCGLLNIELYWTALGPGCMHSFAGN